MYIKNCFEITFIKMYVNIIELQSHTLGVPNHIYHVDDTEYVAIPSAKEPLLIMMISPLLYPHTVDTEIYLMCVFYQ